MPANWPSHVLHAEWVAGGKPDVHVDRFEWKSKACPYGVDRMASWGPMGGVLSSCMLPCERPILELPQDETIVRAHDCQRYVWRNSKQGQCTQYPAQGGGRSCDALRLHPRV